MFKLLQPTEIKCSMAIRTETVCSQTNVLTELVAYLLVPTYHNFLYYPIKNDSLWVSEMYDINCAELTDFGRNIVNIR